MAAKKQSPAKTTKELKMENQNKKQNKKPKKVVVPGEVSEVGKDEEIKVVLPVSIGSRDIEFSKKALEHFQKQVLKTSSEKGSCLGIRIDLVAGGCTGMNYILAPVIKPVVGDLVGRQEKLSFFCPPEALIHLKGLRIDIEKEGLSENIKFTNPLAVGSCGCNASFETELGSSHLKAFRAKKLQESKS